MKEATIADLTSLDPSMIIDLYRIYYSSAEPNSYYPFCGSSNAFNGPIIFQGVSYRPLPFEIDEIGQNIQDRFSRPKLTISNENLTISRILRAKNDFKDAKVVRIRTQLRSLDDANFDSGENPFGVADPEDVISTETFIVSQKISENRIEVIFELCSPMDVEEFDVPGRLILPRYCYWNYRGRGCNYYGPPVEKGDGTAFPVSPLSENFSYASNENEWQYNKFYAAGTIVFIRINRDPYRVIYICNYDHTSNEINQPGINALVWSQEECTKTIGGCRKRFQNTTIEYADKTIDNPLTFGKVDSSVSLPFGGFPSTDKFAYASSR